jgi:hypothetical protein
MQSVVNPQTFFSRQNDECVAQCLQVAGYLGLGNAKYILQITDAKLFILAQQQYDTQACGLAYGFEE